jgi:hypothetical protein
MAIELSNIIFTDQDDIVPQSGVEPILNTGIANTLAGNDTITGTWTISSNFYIGGPPSTPLPLSVASTTWVRLIPPMVTT